MADEQTPPEENEAAGETPGNAPSGGAADGDPVGMDDLDRLLHGELVPELDGESGDRLRALGEQASELLTVGFDSVAGKQLTIAAARLSATDYASVQREFEGTPHIGLVLRLALASGENFLVAALASADDLARLLDVDLTEASMQEVEVQGAQLEMIWTTARELLDLMSLALFTERLSGADATAAEVGYNEAALTVESVAGAADESPPVRVDLSLAIEGGLIGVTLVLPRSMLERLGALLSADDPDAIAAPGEPTSAEPGSQAGATGDAEEIAFGLSDHASSNISSIRGARSASGGDEGVEAHPVRFPSFDDQPVSPHASRSLDLIMDVQMRVSVELGRSTMTVEDVLSLGPGSVVELNKLAGEPVDILVNDQLIARGEVVVVDENFGVRVTEIVSPRRRAHAMGR